jgi:2-polyprenyl-3-methyl-5-hydroxy-6-metoxy-1,4-benzoquinol methylase
MPRFTNNKGSEPCPVCLGTEMKWLFSAKTGPAKFHLVQCAVCALTRTIPFPDDEILRPHDTSVYYGKNENKFIPIIQRIRNEIMRTRAKYYLSMIPSSVQRPKILDVGCAEGRLLKAFLEFGCQCWGVEHSSYPADRFQDPERIAYLRGELQGLKLPEGAFDLIFLWHTLEHMDDPQWVITRLYDLLAPRGALIVAVPNFAGIEARKFGPFWFHLDVPWHKFHFNEESLRFLAAKSGLRVVNLSTFSAEQGPYGLIQSVLNSMGWPRNEFYEWLKGYRRGARGIQLMLQLYMVIILLFPGLLVSILTSFSSRGSELRLILKKK